MSLIKRSDKGSALTFGELDGNFTHLGGDGTYHNAGVRVGGYRPGEIIEVLSTVCDGNPVTVQSGTYTPLNVNVTQPLTTTYQLVYGSYIEYTPPAGTTRVRYEFAFHWDSVENSGISHYKLIVDGVEIEPAYRCIAGAYVSQQHDNQEIRIQHTFVCNAPFNETNNGRYTEWTSPKIIQVLAREYSATYESILHQNVWRDGTGASAPYQVAKPYLTITAMA